MNLWHALIGSLPFEWAQLSFMHDALLAILLVAPLFALLGCMVISNQMAFFSEAMGHASLAGIAIGTLAGLGDPLWAMLGFAVLLAIAVSLLRRYSAASTDTVISIVMALAVALGVVLLSRGGGFWRFSQYLVGNVLTVTPVELLRIAVVLALFLILWCYLFNRIFLTVLNRTLAQSRGKRPWLIDMLFTILVAAVVTVTIPWIGLLVINSLLIIPAATARNVAHNMPQYIWGAIAVSLLAGVSGLICSYYWATASGATIVLFAVGFFVLTLLGRRRG